ncbi:MAG: DUF92 domain-containing protein [Terracidiphilus sp.]|jgi:uncharacterized protein (TIGR00297 family)
MKLVWQSKLVLLLVLPFAAAGVVLQAHWWAVNFWLAAVWTLGLSLLLGLAVVALGAATPAAAFAGTAITASLMFSTATFTPADALPYAPWHTALVPVLAVFLLATIATRLGREKKERLGIAEKPQGRGAAQVAANLGLAALVSSEFAQSWLAECGWFSRGSLAPALLFGVGLAALAEAAADTVSSEMGQVAGGRPRMITTLRRVDPGTDGAISLAGTLAGVAAAGIVATAGTLALGGGMTMLTVTWAGAVFGLFFDSVLGATLEQRGWLNNDAVNFLSTASAAGFALGVLAILSRPGAG